MAVVFICDGCGKRVTTNKTARGFGGWYKPEGWYQRSDDDGTQLACCRTCIEVIADETGKTRVVAPF